jgi:hypothetical protein
MQARTSKMSLERIVGSVLAFIRCCSVRFVRLQASGAHAPTVESKV